MASYIISGTFVDTQVRKRRYYASKVFTDSIYATIRANTGLDTKWGWKAYNHGQTIAAELIEHGLAVGETRVVDIGALDTVTITREN